MTQMIRKQVYLEARHDRMLKRRSQRRGITEAEIIRDALDRSARDGSSARGPGRYDAAAARRAVAFMRALASRRSTPTRGRGWTRDDVYGERIGRWTKS